ncbi:hypothetical protein WJX81_007868 [Elliptochloris bilobata]|uniref:SGNH hydrolase-type esterase domain-containing protein n=1 Tax=Elliptochloris bilobata TaxID=381761 RepID=A0AAW1RT18_9CHLO
MVQDGGEMTGYSYLPYLPYIGQRLGERDSRGPLVFRVFPTEPTELKAMMEALNTMCRETDEAKQPFVQVRPQLYAVQPHEHLLAGTLQGDCTYRGLLQHCLSAPNQRRMLDQPEHAALWRPLDPGPDPTAAANRSTAGGARLPWRGALWDLGGGSTTSVAADPAHARAVLRRAFARETTSSAEMYAAAARNWGEPGRLRRVFAKLLRGELVRVVAVGGSVTTGMGAARPEDAYLNLVTAWLRSLGDETHPVRIEVTNSAVSATTSSYTGQCAHDFVPSDADLVLVEFSVNDWEVADPSSAWMNNSQRRGFERLLRKLLRMKHQPALLVLHWWAPLHFKGSYWNVAEDELDVVAAYYRLQSISFRDAIFHRVMVDEPGFKQEEIMCDVVHPNKLGHRYFADLIIAYLQDVLALTLLTPALAAAATPRLPPPMFPGNDDAGAAICLKGEAFRQSVASMQGGWRWVNEAKPGGQPKWGYVSSTPGDRLTLRITRGPDPGLASSLRSGLRASNMTVLVGLGLLRSHAGVGTALASCGAGCACEPERFQLLHQALTSQVYWHYLLVTMAPPAPCMLDVTVGVTDSNATAEGNTKVKVTSLMVSEDAAEDRNLFTPLGSTDAEGNNTI